MWVMIVKKNKYEEKPVVYSYDTSTITPNFSTYNICYSYQEILEEPTNKNILPFIKKERK